VQIEVVCHGPGIDFLHIQRTGFKEDIYQLKDLGIVFIACENTLKERHIEKEYILPQMEYVEMGIGHLVIKQEQGWSYIKAGF
jgi:intracellular sulfur oxidation DsrE/DsrF family protein